MDSSQTECNGLEFLAAPPPLSLCSLPEDLETVKTVVSRRHSSLAHLLDDGTPHPAAVFAALEKRWASGAVEGDSFADGRSLCAAFDLDVGTLAETGCAHYKLLRSLIKISRIEIEDT